MPPTGDQARNPGMCLDWESNLCDLLVGRTMPNPLSRTSQGCASLLYLVSLLRGVKKISAKQPVMKGKFKQTGNVSDSFGIISGVASK